MSGNSATEHEHEWKTVGAVGDVINWYLVEECAVEGCDAWRDRKPDPASREGGWRVMGSTSATEHTQGSTLEKEGDDYTYARIELTKEDLENLMHGSGFTVEWQTEDETLAVSINSPRELDMDWLRRRSDAFDDPPRRGLLPRLFGVVSR